MNSAFLLFVTALGMLQGRTQFEVMTELESYHLYRDAFRNWFETKLEDLPIAQRALHKHRNSLALSN